MYSFEMAALRYAIFLVFCMFNGSFGIEKDDGYSKLLKRIETLEQEQRDSRLKVERLEHTVNLQSEVIQSQTGQIQFIKNELQTTMSLLQQSNRLSTSNNRKITVLRKLFFEAGLREQNRNADGLEPEVRRQQTTSDGDFLDAKHPTNQSRIKKRGGLTSGLTSGRSMMKRQERAGISFSVYLDHDLDLGSHQTIKFNQVIINDGNGYNTHTGVFTCPEAGVYMFSFFIGQRSETTAYSGTWAELVINSQNVIDAVVDTYHQYQDLQGGNTAIKRLKQGDVVWVDVFTGHVEGRPDLRLSSFSGIFMYP